VKNEIEPSFVNDNYWLLFVFHAYWDKSAAVTDEGMKKLPNGAGSARLVSVKYPAEPVVYARRHLGPLRGKGQSGNPVCLPPWRARKPSIVIAPWAGYKKAGPVLILNRA